MVKYLLYLDSANSLGPNNGQCQWALNQAIVGATSCTVLSMNFVNSIANTSINFNSTQITPSDRRYVGCLASAQPLSLPFFVYILENPSGGFYEGTYGLYLQTGANKFAMSGPAFNFVDVTVTDSASGAIVTGMTPWNMLLEMEVR